MTELSTELVERAQVWMAGDPDPETKAWLGRLIEEGKCGELEACMKPLTFGTAGLRAIDGPGPGRMNLAVVMRTARGLSDTLWRREPDRAVLPVIVGCDARTNSERYAQAVIRVLVGARLNVRYFRTPVPTPLVAFAARAYGAQAAICITASHNPPEYAGFKVYADNAVQIVAPLDVEIAQAIDGVGPANEVPLAPWPPPSGSDAPAAEPIDDLMIERYYAELMAMRLGRQRGESDLKIVYTPMHGVGGKFMLEVLRRAGYRELFPVEQQFDPDPRFPTVPFPNPEEPGALELAEQLAKDVAADLVLSNDPDADRLAVCVPDSSGGFRRLTGNQVGVLLADFVLRNQGPGPAALVVSSVVSSPMIESVSAAHGAVSVRTLTGFKWMLNAALELERERGLRFTYGYEEALGYCVRGPVRDKDGMSAGLLFADLVAQARSVGRTVDDLLRELYEVHGLWASSLLTLEFAAIPSAVDEAADKLRRLASDPPATLGETRVIEIVNYAVNAEQRPWYLGVADLLEFRLEAGARVLVRPSGTEPKLKIYADWRGNLVKTATLHEQMTAAEQAAQGLAQSAANLLL